MENPNTRQYLPSKRVGVIAAVIVISFAGYALIQNYSAVSNLFGGGTPSEQEVAQQLKQSDQDNDGLSDWQENLWNTNPNKRDTDGDGVIDGKEVKQNRDPAKASDDELSVLRRENIENGARQGANTNQTEQIFKQILPSAIVLAQKQQAGTSSQLSSDQVNQIVQQTQQNINVNTEEDRPYSQDDLTTVESTEQTRQAYSQHLTAHLSSVAQQQPGDELLLFAQAAKGQNPERKYQQMREIARLYADMNQDLLGVEVPQSFASQHIRLVNNYHLMALSIEEMTRVDQDPARALSAIQRYRDITRENTNILYQIGQELNQDLDY